MYQIPFIRKFYDQHRELIEYVRALNNDSFVKSNHGKWTPGQQLEHIQLCLKPLAQALASKMFIREKFGTIARSVKNEEQIITQYKAALSEGGKAPDRFVPPEVLWVQKEELVTRLYFVLTTICTQLEEYTDAELDSLVLPHPLLGALTIREMFFLMSYHATHHLQHTQQNLGDM